MSRNDPSMPNSDDRSASNPRSTQTLRLGDEGQSFSDPSGWKRRKEASAFQIAIPSDLSEEQRLLLVLRDEQNMPWKDIAAKFQTEMGRTDRVPALQMRYKRLKEKLRVWTELDIEALRQAYQYWEQRRFDIISEKMLEFGVLEKWPTRHCALKWQELMLNDQQRAQEEMLWVQQSSNPESHSLVQSSYSNPRSSSMSYSPQTYPGIDPSSASPYLHPHRHQDLSMDEAIDNQTRTISTQQLYDQPLYQPNPRLQSMRPSPSFVSSHLPDYSSAQTIYSPVPAWLTPMTPQFSSAEAQDHFPTPLQVSTESEYLGASSQHVSSSHYIPSSRQ